MRKVNKVFKIGISKKNGEKINDIKHRRRVLDIFIDSIQIDYQKESQQHDVKIRFKYPMFFFDKPNDCHPILWGGT